MSNINNAHKLELEVYHALKEVLDPELNINIIDMGLIYSIHYKADHIMYVEMTLSSKACPLGDTIKKDVEETIRKIMNDSFKLELVWEPAWTTDCITPEGKKQLQTI